jgi:hypothetical protein
MATPLRITLSYEGRDADNHEIDMYDAGHAMVGFHRSLALTVHLVLHGEIITQATSLRGARILALPPEEGSWKTIAIIASTLVAAGSITKDSPIGNIISSAYDYVIHETLGFHVDYTKSLGQQYEELKKSHPGMPVLSEPRLHSLSEKCESAIRDIHRPIAFSQTAATANFWLEDGRTKTKIGVDLDEETADYVNNSIRSESTSIYIGQVTGYNTNNYKGRVYVESERRIISFFLDEKCRTADNLFIITNSLTAAAQHSPQYEEYAKVEFEAYTYRSKSGRIKSFHIIAVLAKG